MKGAPPASAADRPGPAAERRAPAAELLIGREPELKALAAFLERPGAGALVLAGEAGIGKTTLWQAGLDLAARQGLPVLSTRASEGEAGMLFAAVADLVDGIDADALGRVPEPQMRALDVALRRAEPGDDPPEPFAVSSGLLSAIAASSRLVSRATRCCSQPAGWPLRRHASSCHGAAGIRPLWSGPSSRSGCG